MNILIYYQNPYRTIFIESLVQSFIQKGHKVYFLTTCERGILHQKIQEMGASIDTYTPQTNKFFQYFKHWKFLIKYCRANKIDVVYSHLQFANLIAVLSQSFITAIVFPCRHHANDVMLRGNKNALRIDKLINKFAKKIIVVSKAVKDQLVHHENVNSDKIEVIKLGYNFDLYNKPSPNEVSKIRERMNCDLLLIIIGRMTVNKRHIIALEALNEIVKEGYNIKMILLDEGPEKQHLIKYIDENNLNKNTIFTGFIDNTMNYLGASDLLIHPSISEASNQVVKEAGYLEKPSIVCKNVGDFNEYILNKQNGFIVSKENTKLEIIQLIKEYYTKKDDLKVIGEKIKSEIINRFGIDNVSRQYLDLADLKSN